MDNSNRYLTGRINELIEQAKNERKEFNYDKARLDSYALISSIAEKVRKNEYSLKK